MSGYFSKYLNTRDALKEAEALLQHTNAAIANDPSWASTSGGRIGGSSVAISKTSTALKKPRSNAREDSQMSIPVDLFIDIVGHLRFPQIVKCAIVSRHTCMLIGARFRPKFLSFGNVDPATVLKFVRWLEKLCEEIDTRQTPACLQDPESLLAAPLTAIEKKEDMLKKRRERRAKYCILDKLEVMEWSCDHRLLFDFPRSLLNRMPLVKSFGIANPPGYKLLEMPSDQGRVFSTPLFRTPSIVEFNATGIVTNQLRIFASFLKSFKGIKSARFSHAITSESFSLTPALFSFVSTLEALSMERFVIKNYETVGVTAFKNLETLRLVRCSTLENSLYFILPSGLKSLVLENFDFGTSANMVPTLISLNNLKHLELVLIQRKDTAAPIRFVSLSEITSLTVLDWEENYESGICWELVNPNLQRLEITAEIFAKEVAGWLDKRFLGLKELVIRQMWRKDSRHPCACPLFEHGLGILNIPKIKIDDIPVCKNCRPRIVELASKKENV